MHAIFLLFHHGIGAPTSHAGFNTFHDGTEDGNELVKERRRKIWMAE